MINVDVVSKSLEIRCNFVETITQTPYLRTNVRVKLDHVKAWNYKTLSAIIGSYNRLVEPSDRTCIID